MDVNGGFNPLEKMEMVELGGFRMSRKEHIRYWPKSEQITQIQNEKPKGQVNLHDPHVNCDRLVTTKKSKGQSCLCETSA